MPLKLKKHRKWLIVGTALLSDRDARLCAVRSSETSSLTVRPAKAGMSSRGRTCRGKSQKPRS